MEAILMPFRVTVDAKGAKEAYDWLHEIGEGVLPMLNALGLKILQAVQTKALRNLSGRYPGPNQENVVSVRTGTLRRLVAAQQVTVEKDGLSWGLPAGELQSRIGRTLEEGGTIRPTKSKFLRIPLAFGGALTAQGVDRNAGRSLRDVPGFRVWPSKGGNLILWNTTKKKPEPWYILKTSVTIRARYWFSDSVEKSTAENLDQLIEGQLSVLLRSGTT
jgi:hypothetical protein